MKECWGSQSYNSTIWYSLLSKVVSDRCWFVVQNWRIPPQNADLLGKMSSWTEESFFPCQMTWFAPQLWSSAQTLRYFAWSSVHPCLSSTVLLRLLVGLRPPSKIASSSHSVSHSVSFILSFRLTMPAASLSVLPKTQLQKAFCLYAGALSLWPTHNLNRYMGCCGCHEILIPVSHTKEVFCLD